MAQKHKFEHPGYIVFFPVPPQNISLSGTEASMFEDKEHTITCTAEKANPAASFQWWIETATERISLRQSIARVTYKQGYYRYYTIISYRYLGSAELCVSHY